MLKKEEYLKTVKRPYPPLFCSLVCIGYAKEELYKGIVKGSFSIKNMAHVDNVWYYRKAEVELGGKLALESWKDPILFDHIKKEFKKREDILVESGKKSYKAFCEAYEKFMPALALIFAIDKPAEFALRKALAGKLSPDKVDELMSSLNVPLQDNTHKQEEYEMINSNDIKGHVKKYEWLNARYGEERTYTIEEANEKLMCINKKDYLKKRKDDKARLTETIDYAKKLLRDKACLVDIFQYIIFYRTHRTDTMNKAAYFAIPMFKNTAKMHNISYDQLMRCASFEVLQDKIPSNDILNQRIEDCSTLLDNGEVSCLTGEESKKLIDFFNEDVDKLNEFKGQAACKGLVKGIAKIIHNKADFDKIKLGDILVASMTTPEMMPILKKASAFVTDEGGVTCHAAIISRELNKPCVIGTKVATKVLKDGDFVEVDANKGTIKILHDKQKPLLSQSDINLKEWEFEFQQRDMHPVLMADIWSRGLSQYFKDEIRLPVQQFDSMLTSKNKGYCKVKWKKQVIDQLKKNISTEDYLKYVADQTMKRVSELKTFADKTKPDLNKDLTNEKIIDIWNKFEDILLKVIPWYYIPWYISEFNLLSDKVKEHLQKHKNKVEKVTDINNALTLLIFPSKDALFQEEKRDFYKLVLKANDKNKFENDKNFQNDAKDYLQRYAWMKTYALLPMELLSNKELIAKVNDAIQNKYWKEYELQESNKKKNKELSEKIVKIISNDKEIMYYVQWAREFAWLLTLSVEQSFKAMADLIPLYKIIAKRANISYEDWIYLTSSDIQEILMGKIKISQHEIDKRKIGYVSLMENGNFKMVFGDEGKQLAHWIDSNVGKVDETIKEFRGQSASPGIAKGKVRKVLRAQDSYLLNEGEILVCSMTSPNYVSAMKKSSAIVTDEGGLLSHAAITSRELNKPCIVGTKIATQILHDGDLIEVNANKGLVKIIKKK